MHGTTENKNTSICV